MRRPRVLLLAEAANPEWVSVPLVGWSHARALADLADVHLVTQVRNAPALRRAGLGDDDFTAIDSERVARTLYRVGSALRGGPGKGWTTVTAASALAYYAFERLVWRRFGADIRSGRFDLVHRLTPLSPVAPSLLAARCARAGVPFILGPLNGGLPWPRGAGPLRRAEREWLSYLRRAHVVLPGYRATRRFAAAIIAGSRATLEQIPGRHRHKCVYIPENGIDPDRFPPPDQRPPPDPLRVAFVGRLVPYKGADVLIRAAVPLVREGLVELDIIGDGPQRPALEALIARERLRPGVRLDGWVDHAQVPRRLRRAHVLGFPSVREFGGAVVIEAMALGLVPIVIDYGGPGEHVTPSTGFRVPLGTPDQIVDRFRAILRRLALDPALLHAMSAAARQRARRWYAWPAKARQTLEVYRWVLGERDRPDFGLPFPDLPAPAEPALVAR